eukprot:906128-Rhodomonas_salina.1
MAKCGCVAVAQLESAALGRKGPRRRTKCQSRCSPCRSLRAMTHPTAFRRTCPLSVPAPCVRESRAAVQVACAGV